MSTNASALHPEQLRPALHDEIDRLSDSDLLVLHRVALQLELDHLSAKLDDGFDQDRAGGKLDRVPDLIRAAREAVRRQAA